LKFQHSMEYFCIMNNQTSNVGGHFALKISPKMQNFKILYCAKKICSAFEISMTILIYLY
jgi:hypothetical protein